MGWLIEKILGLPIRKNKERDWKGESGYMEGLLYIYIDRDTVKGG